MNLQQLTDETEDRVLQLVKAGNRLEAAAVYADQNNISFREATACLDKLYPKGEYPDKPVESKNENASQDSMSLFGTVLGCLGAILVLILFFVLVYFIQMAFIRHFYPQYPTYLSYLKSFVWVKPSLYLTGGVLLIVLAGYIWNKIKK